MELKLFGFIEEVLESLEDKKEDLNFVCQEIEAFFESLLHKTNKGYVNIYSRIKSEKSLKEKIIRHNYYHKYNTTEDLFDNLPDLIGIRLECRFIQDEAELFKFIKKYFNEKYEPLEGYFYHPSNPNIILDLGGKQPKEQKNGFKMFRIDGKYVLGRRTINFEMQIKSLVNVFWSEIEHKVIYKNYNYVIADRFYKDIMKSIKNSLTTIDQQLLLISNQFDTGQASALEQRETQLEKLLSKIIYDIFAKQMQKSIGILVDFRHTCEAIVKYVFRDALHNSVETYSKNLVNGMDKITGLDTQIIDFKKPIIFERKIVFQNEWSNLLGNYIKQCINEEFQWNLFFRVLFEIEPDSNVGDFENYIHYYTQNIYDKIPLQKLNSNFTKEDSKVIVMDIMIKFVQAFIKINSVDLLYENAVEQIGKILGSVTDTIYKNVLTTEQWNDESHIYLDLLELRLLTSFENEVAPEQVLDFLNKVRHSKAHIEIPRGILKNIYKL